MSLRPFGIAVFTVFFVGVAVLASCKSTKPGKNTSDLYSLENSSLDEAEKRILLDLHQLSQTYGQERTLKEWNESVLFVMAIRNKWVADLREILKHWDGLKNTQKGLSLQKGPQLYQSLPALKPSWSPAFTAEDLDPTKIFGKPQFALNAAANFEREKWFFEFWIKAMAAAGQNQKLKADIQGKEIQNFTDVLKAQGQGIRNQLDMMRGIGYSLYLKGYQSQVQSYIAYAQTIQQAYQQKMKNARALSRSIRNMRDYQRKVNLCQSRAGFLYRDIGATAGQENLYRKTSWNLLQDKLMHYANKDYGSYCLASTMLTMSEAENDAFAQHFRFVNYKTPDNVALVCPTSNQEELLKKFPNIEDLKDEDALVPLSTYGYPHYFDISQDMAGVMIPTTPYQMYRLLTAPNPYLRVGLESSDGEISQPVDQCYTTRTTLGLGQVAYKDRFNEYTLASQKHEKKMFNVMAKEDSNRAGKYKDFIRQASPVGAAKYRSVPHTQITKGMHRVFDATDRCMADMRLVGDIEIEIGTPEADRDEVLANTFDRVKIQNGEAISSLLAGFHHDYYPEESLAIRACMASAAEYRNQALLSLEPIQSIQEILDKEADSPAPKGMLPLFPPDMNLNATMAIQNR